jgi:hypothetical protein
MAGFVAGELVTAADFNAGLGLRQRLTLTSSTTFDKADYPWLRHVQAHGAGGGGAGAGAATTGVGELSIGGGGRGGSYSRRLIAVASLPTSVTVTIGAGGAGVSGGAGSNGGATTFGTFITATGGLGGETQGPSNRLQTASSGGVPTISVIGDVNTAGGAGGPGIGVDPESTNGVQGGQGGDSFFGAGGPSQNQGTGGVDGVLFGGGGGGGARKESSSAVAGGDGAAGVVVLELYA